MQKRHMGKRLSEDHVGWQQPSRCTVPNSSLLAEWRKSESHPFSIDNELQACGDCEVVGEWRFCHDYLELEKFSSLVRTSARSSHGSVNSSSYHAGARIRALRVCGIH
jgi:hypothetical protein